MEIYKSWTQLVEMQQKNPQMSQSFWNEYFEAEKQNYKKLLANNDKEFSGKVSELAKEFEMEPTIFAGFLDGINESLKEKLDLDALTEESEVSLAVDFERLFYNMCDAKADWLYSLPEWENILPGEKRAEITKQWRLSGQATSQKIVGRNDPCPCGSGKKYKKCCGK